jgi:hypothetical protein
MAGKWLAHFRARSARKLFRATGFCRQRFTIAADFVRRFGWSALAGANKAE